MILAGYSYNSFAGFVHYNLSQAPDMAARFNPIWSTNVDLDFAGNVPSTFVRIGNSNGYRHDLLLRETFIDASFREFALSTDGGVTWTQNIGEF